MWRITLCQPSVALQLAKAIERNKNQREAVSKLQLKGEDGETGASSAASSANGHADLRDKLNGNKPEPVSNNQVSSINL